MSSLLPHNSTLLERAIEGSVVSRLDFDVQTDLLLSPDNCPDEALPFLAWALSVDVWDSGWTLERKREVVRNSIFVHRHKGTAGAVARSIESLGLGARLIEWFEDGGDPYTFKVEITPQGSFTLNDLRDVLTSIEQAKNIRSHLEALIAVFRQSLTVYTGTALRGFVTMPLSAARVPEAAA